MSCRGQPRHTALLCVASRAWRGAWRAGGIGLSIHCIRATGSYIRGTNGTSNGVVPMLRVFNDTARCACGLATALLLQRVDGLR